MTMYELPYGNTQQLNLDWFIKRWKEFYEEWEQTKTEIDGALDEEVQKVEDAMEDLYAARDAAAASATAAAASAASASNDATIAANAATAAAASATLANTKATAAGLSEAAAALSASQAANDATAAATSASQASASASSATDSAQAAAASATAADSSADDAADSATAAAGSATAAAGSASDAADSATAAAASAASLVVDSAMSDSSTNPVQNKVINGELTELKTALGGETENLSTGETKGRYYNSSGKQTGSVTGYFGSTDFIPVKAGRKYYAHFYNYGGSATCYSAYYASDMSYINRESTSMSGKMFAFTTPENCAFVGVFMYKNGGLADTTKTKITVCERFETENYIPNVTAVDYVARNEINPMSATVRTIAHRGDMLIAPACTEPAYVACAKHGIRIAENDLNESEDGEFVMWHNTTFSVLGDMYDIEDYAMYTDGTDYYWVKNNSVYTYADGTYTASAVSLASLTRCNGTYYSTNSTIGGSGVTGLNLNILKRIDVGRYKGDEFKGTPILTFEGWVLLCKKLGLEIYIDKKITYTDAKIESVVKTVKKLGMADHATWIVSVAADIPVIRSFDTNARVAILAHPTEDRMASYAQYNIGRGVVFNGDAETITSTVASNIQDALLAGFQVECYYAFGGSHSFATNKGVIDTAVNAGVQGITTDHYRIDEFYLSTM